MEMPEMEEKYFLQAIKTNGSNVNAFQGIAGFYLRQGNAEKAKEYFNRVLKLKPDDQYAKIKLDSLNGIKN